MVMGPGRVNLIARSVAARRKRTSSECTGAGRETGPTTRGTLAS